MPTAAFTTLGCKVNQYETQRILESFEAAGFAVVPFDSPADVYVINTCSVTAVAESKSRYMVRRATRSNPQAKVVVTGCASQMAVNSGGTMLGADLTVPNPEKERTLALFLQGFPDFERWAREEPAPASHRPPPGRTRATLKVQDGCDVMCSYCSIPYTRPGLRSRPFGEVVDEAKALVDAGYREAVLTGVLIGAYGPETGSGGPSFEDLVVELATKSGLARVRISSIEMHQVTPPIVELAKSGHVAPHLHIPLQSGDDQVLCDMNRRYSRGEYMELCERLKQEVPDLSLTTDVMVGFPTETPERFESSLDVLERVGFLKAHVFRFSSRPGTPADQWGDPVSDKDKQERSARLIRVSERTGHQHVHGFLGRKLRVLVEGKAKVRESTLSVAGEAPAERSPLMEGHTDNYIQVRFVGSPSLVGTLQWVRIDEVAGTSALGEMVAV